jgi:hypothetical protein
MTIRETIEHNGQAYLDEPVYVKPKPEYVSPIAVAIAEMFDRKPPEPIKVAHNRVKLRWLTPDKNGKLIPKYPNREAI